MSTCQGSLDRKWLRLYVVICIDLAFWNDYFGIIQGSVPNIAAETMLLGTCFSGICQLSSFRVNTSETLVNHSEKK